MPISASKNKPVRKRATTWKRVEKKDRRNLKMWAEGARESILRPHLAAYTDALERGWRAERDYLLEVCREFHAKICWRLEDHEEPELPLPEFDPFALPEREDLDDAELERKQTRIEQMNARIARWLKYRARVLRRPTKMDRSRDPWAILLAKLAGINSPPKARQAFQQYMHESYDSDIGPVVEARWAASPVEADGLTLKSRKGPDAPFRAKVARELFAELSTEDQDGLKERAKAEAKEARDRYVAAMKNGASKAPEDRQRCIDNLGAFMTAILRGVHEYTGLSSFAVFGGPMPQFGGEIRTLHCAHGRNHGATPVLFPAWSTARFNRDVLDFMREFLATAYTPVECAEAALVVDGEAGPLYTIPQDMGFEHGASDGESSDDDSAEGDGSDSEESVDSDIERDLGKKKGKGRRGGKETKVSKEKRKDKAKKTAESATGGKRKRDTSGSGESGRRKKVRVATAASTSSADVPQPMAPEEEQDASYQEQAERAKRVQGAVPRRSARQPRGKSAASGTETEGTAGEKDVEMTDVTQAAGGSSQQVGPVAREEREAALTQRVHSPVATRGPPLAPPASTPEERHASATAPAALARLPPTGRQGQSEAPAARWERGAPPPTMNGHLAPPPSASALNAMGAAGVNRPRPLYQFGGSVLRQGGGDGGGVHPMWTPTGERSTGNGGAGIASRVGTPATGAPPPPLTLPPTAPPPPPSTPLPPASTTPAMMAGMTTTTTATTPPGGSAGDFEVWDCDDVPVCPPDAAGWFTAAYKEVSGELSGKKLGGVFNGLLRVFIELERGAKWENLSRGFAKKPRLPQVNEWIAAGRGGRGGAMANGVGPVIASVVLYEERWWAWWATLQPKWRKADGGKPGRFARDNFPAPPTANDWATLRFPGPNGVLSLVASLYWWGVKLEKEGQREEQESWVEAVSDVRWMVRGVVAAQKAGVWDT